MAERSSFHPFVFRLLAGLEAGVAAAVVMAGYMLVENALFEASPWHAPRLFSLILLGSGATYTSPALLTVVGYSLLLAVSGAQGLLFGLMVPPGVGSIWSANFAVVLSLGWYLLVLRSMVAAWSPYLLFRFSQPWLLLGYFLFGAFFGLYPRLHYRISRPVPAAEPAPAPPPAEPAEAEKVPPMQ